MRASLIASVCLLVLLFRPGLILAGPFEQGIAALDARDYDRAIACFDACIRQNPQDISALGNRGLAYFGKKDFDRAIADSTVAILLNPKIAVLYTVRANAYSEKKQYDRAIADYSSANGLDPKQAANLRGRANAYSDKLEFDKALADYTLALKLDPKDPVLLCNRGTAFFNRRLYARAIADFRKALELDPKYVAAWNGFAWLLATCPNEQLRDGKLAVAYATKACELTNWKSADPVCTLAAAQAESGNFTEAIRLEKLARSLGLASKYEIDRSQMRLKLYEANEPFRNQ